VGRHRSGLSFTSRAITVNSSAAGFMSRDNRRSGRHLVQTWVVRSLRLLTQSTDPARNITVAHSVRACAVCPGSWVSFVTRLNSARKPRRYHGFMLERPRKRPTDLNRLAASIVDEATGNAPDPDAGRTRQRSRSGAWGARRVARLGPRSSRLSSGRRSLAAPPPPGGDRPTTTGKNCC